MTFSMKPLYLNNSFCDLDKKNSDVSVRVILKDEKLYREQIHISKFLFSIQVLLISVVKPTRIDEILSKSRVMCHLDLSSDCINQIKVII